jgi:hypothetical protein
MKDEIKKICFRCHKKIEPNENYYAMIEFDLGKWVSEDYVHKVCWDKFLSSLDGANNSLKKSNYLLNALGNQMQKMGMLPEQEIVL